MAASKAFWGEEKIIEKNILNLINYNQRLVDRFIKFGDLRLKQKTKFLSKKAGKRVIRRDGYLTFERKTFKEKEKFRNIFLRKIRKQNNILREKEKQFLKEIRNLEKYDNKGDVRNALKHAIRAENLIKQCENIIIKEFRETLHYFEIYPEEQNFRREIVGVLTEERRDVEKERYFLTKFKARVR